MWFFLLRCEVDPSSQEFETLMYETISTNQDREDELVSQIQSVLSESQSDKISTSNIEINIGDLSSCEIGVTSEECSFSSFGETYSFDEETGELLLNGKEVRGTFSRAEENQKREELIGRAQDVGLRNEDDIRSMNFRELQRYESETIIIYEKALEEGYQNIQEARRDEAREFLRK